MPKGWPGYNPGVVTLNRIEGQMKKILLIAGLFIIGGSSSVLAMGDLYVSGTWRYKMTVTVETPEGIKTGSAVREVSNSTSSVRLDLPEAGNPPKYKGEAVVIDLGKRGYLFALGSYKEFYGAFPVKAPDTIEGIKYYNSLPSGEKTSLKRENFPWFVIFTDINDPQSIKTIDPDNLSEVFGVGVKLKEITVEITEDQVTWGEVRNALKWFREKKMGLKFADPQITDQAKYLSSSSFAEGVP